MIDILCMPQGSDEWHQERLGSLGSSSVKNAIAGGEGKSRKTLAYGMVAERISGERTYFKTTAAMDEGNRREPESRDWYAFYSGIEWEEVGLIKNSLFPGQHTSPDAVNRDLKIGLELKNVTAKVMVQYLDKGEMAQFLDKGTMVSTYVAQCQHAMMITGWNKWHFVVYHPAFKRQLVVIVDRDDKYISTMQQKIDTFFTEMNSIMEKVSTPYLYTDKEIEKNTDPENDKELVKHSETEDFANRSIRYTDLMGEALEKKTSEELDVWRMKHSKRIMRIFPERDHQNLFFAEVEKHYQILKARGW